MRNSIIYTLAGVIIVLLFCIAFELSPHSCGMCGASIHDVWQVQSDSGNLVDVCQLCYQDMRD